VDKKIKVFCDSNIFLSAIYTDFKNSYPSLIIKLAENNFFDIYFSNLVELEVKYNIEKKIPQKIDVSNKLFRKFIRVEDVIIELEILNKLPEKDRIILSTAIYYRMDYFISIPPSLKKRGGGRFYKVQNANCKMKELKTKFPF